jgi:hypothetical protein
MLSLRDKLSHLKFKQASKLLGPEGETLILKGGKFDIDIESQVRLNENFFHLSLDVALVTIEYTPEADNYLRFKCSQCDSACEHLGAAFSLILEEKLVLGLSAPPPEKTPVENLSEEALVQRAIDERRDRSKNEKMKIKSLNDAELWTDYIITNNASGKTYRVAMRGWIRGQSYCSCPDFRKNTLGTCKHVLYTTDKLRKEFTKKIRETPYKRNRICVHMNYGEQAELQLLAPEELDKSVEELIRPYRNGPITDVHTLLRTIRELEHLEHEVSIYPDAEEVINKQLPESVTDSGNS